MVLGHKIVFENKRPIFPEDTPPRFQTLAEKCWHQSPESRRAHSACEAQGGLRPFDASESAWGGSHRVPVCDFPPCPPPWGGPTCTRPDCFHKQYFYLAFSGLIWPLDLFCLI